jgi:hypothetical protein
MVTLSFRQIVIIAASALVIWILCGALMFAALSPMSLESSLVVHAAGAPVIGAVVAWFYFKRFPYPSPLMTALLFVAVVILMDFFVVALLIERGFAMFASILGTWLTFALIFLAVYLTRHVVSERSGTAKTV